MMLRRNWLRSLESLESRLTPASVFWTNPSGGAWETKTNWSTGDLPAATDDVFLFTPGGSGTITLSSIRTVNSLTVDTTPLTLTVANAGNLTVSTTNTVPSTVQTGGTLTVSGEQLANVTLTGGTHSTADFKGFTLAATSGSSKFGGTLNKTSAVDGADLLVNAGATLTLSAATVNLPSATTLRVEGTLNGTGTAAVSAGTLSVAGSVSGVATNLTNATVSVRSGDAGTITTGGTWTGTTFEVENTMALPAGKVTIAGQTLSGSQAGTLKAGSAGVPAAHAVQLNGVGVAAAGATFNFAPGLLTWTAGNFNQPITNNGELTYNVAGAMNPTSVTTNNGTFIHVSGSINENGSPSFTNAAGATYDIRGDHFLNWNIFVNKGSLSRTAGTGTTTFSYGTGGSFSNSGSLNVQTGTLVTPNAGTTTGATYTVAAGAILDLGPQAYAGTITASGAGLVRFAAGFTATGGATEFNVPTPGLLQWTGGSTHGTWKNSGIFTINSTGNVVPSGIATNTGTVVHLAGSVNESGSPTFTNAPGAVYDIRGDHFINWSVFTNNGSILRSAGTGTATFGLGSSGGSFNNTGTITVQTGTLSTPSAGTTTGATYSVAAGAILDLGPQAYAGTITASGAGLVRFAAGFIATGGATEFNVPTPGLLQWTGGSTQGTWKNSGHFSINSTGNVVPSGIATNTGTVVHLAGGVTESGSPTFTNAPGAVYDIRGDHFINWSVFTNNGSILRSAGTGTATFGLGSSGGSFNNTGTITVQTGTLSTPSAGTTTGATYTVAAGAILDLGPQTYAGTITGSGAGLIRFAAGFTGSNATFNFATTDLLQWTGGSTFGTWTNAGSLTINAPMGANPRGAATNSGTIIHAAGTVFENGSPSLTNAPGAVYDIRGDFNIDWSSFINHGTIKRSAGTGTAAFLQGFANNGGTIDIQTGMLDLPGTLTMNGGKLQGNGTLLAPVTGIDGSIRPGNSAGQLTVTGNYSQTKAAELRIELNGTTPVTEYDQLFVNGTVTLGGPLELFSGYGSKLGDTFLILDNDGTDKIGGTFANLPEGAKFYNNGVEYQITYISGTGNDVRLTVTSLESVVVNIGAAQRSRLTRIDLHYAAGINTALLSALGGVTLTRTAGGPSTVVQTGATGANGRITVTPGTGTATTVILTFDNANGNAISAGVEYGSLADGDWQLHIPSLNYTSTLGDDYFHRLFGDGDGNATVDGSDLTQFGNSFNTSDSTFDYNADGTVDGSDLTQFGNRFGNSL